VRAQKEIKTMTEQLDQELARCRSGQAARLAGVSVQTMHVWRQKGRIKAVQDASGRWLFDVRPFVKGETKAAS
jgi:hypothetical protein